VAKIKETNIVVSMGRTAVAVGLMIAAVFTLIYVFDLLNTTRFRVPHQETKIFDIKTSKDRLQKIDSTQEQKPESEQKESGDEKEVASGESDRAD
ncbi:hypothetical protein MUP59_06855, partial [Candidatus Bathyarchaeota archaeon]|nr:hypothetical protein [Candidatus Bathyarchaeota archaeon]